MHEGTLPRELANVASAASDDLALLAGLHDRELSIDSIRQLAAESPHNWFALSLTSEDSRVGFNLLAEYLAQFASQSEDEMTLLDTLAADYADLYLTFGKRISPTESFWLTEDHIERQEPMFEVRRWYRHHGMSARDWRKRSDDHLVLQLDFVAQLLKEGTTPSCKDAGRFLDRHLRRWSRKFLGGMAEKATTQFYAGLGLITQAILEEVRSIIEEITEEPRTEIATILNAQSTQATDSTLPLGLRSGW